MKTLHPLKTFESIVDHFGYTCVLHKASKEIPFELLAINIPPDNKKRDRKIFVKIDEYALETPKPEEKKENIETFVQLSSVLPFNVDSEVFGEAARIINFIDESLETPGFVLDEINSRIFFRYSFLKPGSKITNDTFISLLGTVMLLLDSFSNTIEEVVQGKAMSEVIQEKIDALKALSPA